MPIQEIMRLRSSGDEEINMSITLAMNCASVLTGSRVANIVTLPLKWIGGIGFLLAKIDISYLLLRLEESKAIVYLYRKRELSGYLRRREIAEFLRGYGYSGGLYHDLQRLSGRILQYADGDAKYPHEVGIFLGYPLADVIGFIDNEGQNYEYAGYWKVYDNVQEAMELFRVYDDERERMVNALISGKTLSEAAVAI